MDNTENITYAEIPGQYKKDRRLQKCKPIWSHIRIHHNTLGRIIWYVYALRWKLWGIICVRLDCRLVRLPVLVRYMWSAFNGQRGGKAGSGRMSAAVCKYILLTVGFTHRNIRLMFALWRLFPIDFAIFSFLSRFGSCFLFCQPPWLCPQA